MSAVEEIRIKLENRLTAVEAEIESLRSALSALDAQATASASAARSRTRSASPRRRRSTSGRADDAEAAPTSASVELERLLAETGGMSAVELARQTGTDYGQVLARIRELERAGRARDGGSPAED